MNFYRNITSSILCVFLFLVILCSLQFSESAKAFETLKISGRWYHQNRSISGIQSKNYLVEIYKRIGLEVFFIDDTITNTDGFFSITIQHPGNVIIFTRILTSSDPDEPQFVITATSGSELYYHDSGNEYQLTGNEETKTIISEIVTYSSSP